MRRLGGVVVAVGLVVAGPASAQDDPPEEDAVQDDGQDEDGLEVVSVASPVVAGADPTPATFRIAQEELERPGLRMADALARVPGVQTRRSGGAADLATASIRGSTSAQTPIYLSGVRLNDDFTGTVDLSTLPLWMLRRVDVFRGTAPAEADELGIGGAVRLVPRRPAGLEARAALGLGSFGEREARGAFSAGSDEGGATVALRHRSGDGDFPYLDDGGTRFDESDDVERRRANADHRELDVWALGDTRVGGAHLGTFVNAFERSGGAPGLQLNGARFARSDQRRVLGGLSAAVPCSHQGCTVAVDLGMLLSRYRLRDPRMELGTAERVDQQGERLTERVRWAMPVGEALDLGAGALLEQQWLRLSANRQRVRSARRTRVRPELSALLRPVAPVTVAGVAALECQRTAGNRASEETCDLLEPVGRVGVRWQALEGLALFGNVGRYVRAPTLGELFGISAVTLGNEALVPEDGLNVDAGVNLDTVAGPARIWAQVVGFGRLARDLIVYRRSSFGASRPFNARSARLLGAELAAGATLFRWLDLSAAVTVVDPRDTSEDRQTTADLLPFTSRLVAAPQLGLRSPSWSTVGLDEAAVSVHYLYRASRVADPAGLIVLPEQHLVDLDASLAFLQTLVLRGRIANLGDQRTVDLLGYPLPGRSFHGMAEARW